MKTGRTSSGLQYAVLRSGKAVAYCSLSIKCGSRDEAGFPSGIAHFTEHTIFKGTSKRKASAISGYLDKLGGELNAYTTKEEIVIHATVLKEDLRKAESLLMELATDSIFPEKEIETEKGVVIDEIISYKDSPADDIYDRFEGSLFKGHPLGNPILGTVASVKKISSDDLRGFVARNFTPDRMAFCVVADIDEARSETEVLQLSEKYFGSSPVVQHAELARQTVMQHQQFDITANKRNHEVNAIIGGYAPSLYDEGKRINAVLLSNLLGGPASNSILNSILRERNGWVYGVECGYTQYSDSGIMTVSIGCDRCNLDKCLDAIKREILKLRTKELNDRKLSAAKRQLIAQLAVSSDNGETQCLSAGKSLLSYGFVASSEQNRKAIESITPASLRAIADEIFDERNISRLIFL